MKIKLVFLALSIATLISTAFIFRNQKGHGNNKTYDNEADNILGFLYLVRQRYEITGKAPDILAPCSPADLENINSRGICAKTLSSGDSWGTKLCYRHTQTNATVCSAGFDRVFDTQDDLRGTVNLDNMSTIFLDCKYNGTSKSIIIHTD